MVGRVGGWWVVAWGNGACQGVALMWGWGEKIDVRLGEEIGWGRGEEIDVG